MWVRAAMAVIAAACAVPAAAGDLHQSACIGVPGDVLSGKFSESAALCGDGTIAALGESAAVEDRAQVSIPVAGPALRQALRRVAREGGPRAGDHGALIARVARAYRIDPGLLAAMVRTESGNRPDAVSHKGALGLMQVMPATARGLGVAEPERLLTDQTLAVETGARYLKQLQARFGNNVPIVVAAYNAGPGAVAKAGMRVPNYTETRGYVVKVMERYQASRTGPAVR